MVILLRMKRSKLICKFRGNHGSIASLPDTMGTPHLKYNLKGNVKLINVMGPARTEIFLNRVWQQNKKSDTYEGFTSMSLSRLARQRRRCDVRRVSQINIRKRSPRTNCQIYRGSRLTPIDQSLGPQVFCSIDNDRGRLISLNAESKNGFYDDCDIK